MEKDGLHWRGDRRTALNQSSGVRLVDWDSGTSHGGVMVVVLEWQPFPEWRRVSLAIVVGRQEFKGMDIRVVLFIALNTLTIYGIPSICVT